ncbi:G-type lectin S-receptor-like serine/threonine-protein kinase B120 isoform X2 [Euphorbia lathyris]|uniref:G-type lectin S-receptor-like serine/threonine-protein kinase B120 isoform X2 n=1 Tax=Euphorbia lathyris TaxID=212925 RepID=UPI0033143567
MAFISKPPIFTLFFLFSLATFCSANNTITKGQSIKDGETLLSDDENFELGFFPLGDSNSRYVGIRYHEIENKSIIWIANREKPIPGTGGIFTIGGDGNLRVEDGNGVLIWSSNASQLSNTTQATLHPTGNLVLSDTGDAAKVYWESFKHPTDTFLPNMKIIATGEKKALISWKSATDPSPGNFSLGIDVRGAPQLVIWEETKRRWRSGYWNGQIFTGVPDMAAVTSVQYGFKIGPESDGNFAVTYNPRNAAALMRFQITWEGVEKQVVWNETEKKWDLIQKQPANNCGLYNFCGNFGVCNAEKEPLCSCMDGYIAKDEDQWGRRDWSSGCMRRTELQCERNSSFADGFKEIRCNKLPDFAEVHSSLAGSDCEKMCLNNCSCNGYAEVANIGCMIWNDDLIDIQDFGKPGIVMFLRLAGSELDVQDSSSKGLSAGVIAGIVIGGVVFLVIIAFLLWRLKAKLQVLPAANSNSLMKKSEIPFSDLTRSKGYSSEMSGPVVIDGSAVNGPDLPLYSFNSLAVATDNFSEQNKLGHGGFGHVYKGKLPGGEEIAVKRLSKISGQGMEEFKNEIILIAKLQHRNLVRLLGCCIEGEEKMLLYEYMPNKSLDFFLFDPAKQALLDWKKRFNIIEGIARGLLYLHRDSRLRIIHRDLKASNILLDEEMTPKISDFGMARIFGGNQNEINTNKIVGTYGYMSPEYAMEGLFSVKSDVYSFGVLLLELVTGRRNSSYRSTDHVCLTAYAWDLWNEDKATELIDASIRESSSRNEVMRCIQVAMLCVQDSAVSRPTMSKVILMLESNNTTLPLPKQPTYSSMRGSIDTFETFTEGHEIKEIPGEAMTWS